MKPCTCRHCGPLPGKKKRREEEECEPLWCPSCGALMSRGSMTCRPCALERMKKEIGSCFIKDKPMTYFVQFRREKKWRG